MLEYISNLLINIFGISKFLSDPIAVMSALLLLVSLSYTIHLVVRYIIVPISLKKFTNTYYITWQQFALKHNTSNKLYSLLHLIFIYLLLQLLNADDISILVHILNKITMLSIIVIGAALTNSLLSIANELYQRSFLFAQQRPIKSYLDFLKILIWILAVIFIISNITNKSPATMLTGLGAASAILILVFKDYIMGFVSSIQISAYDIVRINDWIEVPKHNVEGVVTDISLNAIKIQNFDKTFATIPTHELITTALVNWRGMKEAGGRRIKRDVCIDTNTIKFCDSNLVEKLSKLKYLSEYIAHKKYVYKIKKDSQEFTTFDSEFTNINLYRTYVKNYLNNRADIQQAQFTFIVRQLRATGNGLPIELYIFTKTIDWVTYEEIQSDIFDHIISVLPVFELKLFQNISNAEIPIRIERKCGNE